MRGSRAMTHLAEVAIVLARCVGGDNLALSAGERVGSAQQKFGQNPHGGSRFGPERQEPDDSRQAFGECDVCHEWFSSVGKSLETAVLDERFEEYCFARVVTSCVTGHKEHEAAGNECGQCQQLNRSGTIGPKRVEYPADYEWPGSGTDGISSPGKRVESREAFQAEVAADDKRRDVSLAAGAESDERGRDHGCCLGMGNREKKNGQARNQQHCLIDAHPKEAVQERPD